MRCAHLQLGQPLALELQRQLEPLGHVERLEQLDLLLEGEVGRVAGGVGQRAGLGDRAQEGGHAAVVAAQLEDLLDDGAVLALELAGAPVDGDVVGVLLDLDAQRRRRGRCWRRRRRRGAGPRERTARPPPGRRTRSATSATVPTRGELVVVARDEQHALLVADVDRAGSRHVREDDGVVGGPARPAPRHCRRRTHRPLRQAARRGRRAPRRHPRRRTHSQRRARVSRGRGRAPRLRGDDGRISAFLRSITEPGPLADTAGFSPDITHADKVELLETVDVTERLELALSLQRDRLAELQVRATIRDDVQSGAEKQQREYFLRKQMESIRKELGEDDDSIVDEYRAKIEDAGMPDDVRRAGREGAGPPGAHGRAVRRGLDDPHLPGLC